jgi:hypothetical protein
MSETPENESLRQLRQRLEEIDDAVVVRVLAVLDAAGELHRQSNERIDRLANQIDRNALAIAQNAIAIDRLASRFDAFVTQAEADRAVMLQLLRVMAGQQPNGKGEGESQ